MRDDRLIEMRVFRAVVEAGSFTAAAHLLGVSQPFVSQSIGSLEHRLGVRLLHRTTRKQRLTAEGERYLSVCRSIIDTLEQADATIGTGEPTGTLRISAPQAFGTDQIVPLLPAFVASHPRLNVHVSLSDNLVNLIEDNIDVAIRMGKMQDSALIGKRLCHLQRIVVAAPSYLQRHGTPLHPHDLAEHECLTWHAPWEHLNQWPFVIDNEDNEMQRVSVHGRLRSSDGGTLFQLCVAGMGIMRLAEHLALPAIADGRLVPLLGEFLARDEGGIFAVYLPERKLVPRIRAFVDHVAQAFSEPPWTRRPAAVGPR